MRGEVLHYDDEQGVGFIADASGKRYSFERSDLRRLVPLGKGTPVEFQPEGDVAREIFVVRAERPATGAAPSQFGRFATSDPAEKTGLWSYFWRGITGNYGNFRGRARRKEVWGFYLFYCIALLVFALAGAMVDALLGNFEGKDTIPIATLVLPVVFILAALVPHVAVSVRRQHDIGLSGWFYLLFLLPYVGSLILLVFALIPSQKHENKWGPVPAGVRLDTAPVDAPAA